MTASEKLSAFIHKLPVWKRRVENFNFANFLNPDINAGLDPDINAGLPKHLLDKFSEL